MTEYKYTAKRLAQEIEAELAETYELVYVASDDKLTDEQVNALLSGDWETLEESIDEWASESRRESVKYILDDLSGRILDDWIDAIEYEDDGEEDGAYNRAYADIDGLRMDFYATEEWDELRFIIEERDTSDVIKQLASHTPDTLFRVAIEDFDGSCWDKEEGDEPKAVELLKLAGLPLTDENIKAADSVIANADTYGTLYYLFAANVADLMDAREGDSITVTNPHVLLSNAYAGNGHEEEMIGEVTFPAEDLRTDAKAFGYSWNEIAGVYTSAYSTDVKITKKAEVA